MAEATVSSSGPRRHLVWVEKPGSDRWLAPSPPQLPDHPGCFELCGFPGKHSSFLWFRIWIFSLAFSPPRNSKAAGSHRRVTI